MCTAINYTAGQHYFGRNLDLEYTYQESVTVTPRNYPLTFRLAGKMETHYAMIGMAYVQNGYPLYYEATNEKGVSMAGLMFSGNAYYQGRAEGKDNIPPFELIPWILAQCKNMQEVRRLLEKLNLLKLSFSEELPLTPLHWMIAYKEESLVVESEKDGLRIYENPVGVLTNNPGFSMQLWNINNYMKVSREAPLNCFSGQLCLKEYSRGMGGIGLPGDLSSASRFVRAAFVLHNSVSGETEEEQVGQFFHILTAVEQQRGCVHMEGEQYEITAYSSCCNTEKGIYYYTTYGNRQISAIDMRLENLDGKQIVSYSLVKNEQIFHQNSGKK